MSNRCSSRWPTTCESMSVPCEPPSTPTRFYWWGLHPTTRTASSTRSKNSAPSPSTTVWVFMSMPAWEDSFSPGSSNWVTPSRRSTSGCPGYQHVGRCPQVRVRRQRGVDDPLSRRRVAALPVPRLDGLAGRDLCLAQHGRHPARRIDRRAWAALKRIGRDGYLDLARGIMGTSRHLIEGINAIPGLRILGDPPASVFAFASDEVDIYAVGDVSR